jgi:putative membrane protein
MIGFGGPLTGHMTTHILLMNVVAPFAVLMSRPMANGWLTAAGRQNLVTATILQLALIWAWHSPPLLEASLTTWTAGLAMSGSLLAAALWFWHAVLTASGTRRWQSVVALLVTAKIFCLLGALLVFSPRLIYATTTPSPGQDVAGALADQHLAGLLMLAACPLTYVSAGVLIAARWIAEVDDGTKEPLPDPHRETSVK